MPLGSFAFAAAEGWLPFASKNNVHGSAQSPNGAGKILAGQQQVLASLLRAKLASDVPKVEPRLLLRVQLSRNDDGCS